jgi:hypothetical protein
MRRAPDLLIAVGIMPGPPRSRLAGIVTAGTASFLACGTPGNAATPANSPGGMDLAVSPPVVVLAPGGTHLFTATGADSRRDGEVTWSVVEPGGGSVDSGGRYAAPAAAGVYHLVARSAARPTETATATLVVGILAPDRTTVWNPGIPGGIPERTRVGATVGPPYDDGKTDATRAIQSAIDACPVGGVVLLGPGTFSITQNLWINKGITLRGAGSTRTQLRAHLRAGSVAAIYVSNANPTYGAPAVDVTADVPKGSTTLPVSHAASFRAGDLVQIDQLDDRSYLYDGADPYFKRPDYGPPSDGHRSMGQTALVTAVGANTLTIADPVHLTFSKALHPQVFKPDGPPPPPGSLDPPGVVERAGIEDLYVTGGQNNEIQIQQCAFCWVARVESDGTTPAATTAADGVAGPGLGMSGAHVLVDKSYRVVIRDSYLHHATHIVQGGGAYGVSLSAHTSESLVENDIVYDMNKPLTLRASGGGNVIAYDYFDDAWTSADPRLQETTLDLGHTSFPHMELVEGNYAPQIATEDVWGNSGFMTVFRNEVTSQQRRTAGRETYQIAAISFEAQSRSMNVVANVLGAAGRGLVYEVHAGTPGPRQAAVWRLGQGVGAGGGGDAIDAYEDPTKPGSTAAELFRHANFDYVTNRVHWNENVATRALPDSLYLTRKPAFFGSNPWPWVDPTGATKAAVLPAKARFDACVGPSGC